jgi:hypothetical protein
VSKQQTLDAVGETARPGAKGSLSALKKVDLAEAAEKKLKKHRLASRDPPNGVRAAADWSRLQGP